MELVLGLDLDLDWDGDGDGDENGVCQSTLPLPTSVFGWLAMGVFGGFFFSVFFFPFFPFLFFSCLWDVYCKRQRINKETIYSSVRSQILRRYDTTSNQETPKPSQAKLYLTYLLAAHLSYLEPVQHTLYLLINLVDRFERSFVRGSVARVRLMVLEKVYLFD